jgi:hypothetical protein
MQASLKGRAVPVTQDDNPDVKPDDVSKKSPSGRGASNKAGPAIGGAVGAVVVLCGAVAALIFWKQHRKAPRAKEMPPHFAQYAHQQHNHPSANGMQPPATPVYNMNDVRPSLMTLNS